MSVSEKLIDKYDLGRQLRLVQVKCVAVSPSFTVSISGGTSEVAAKRVAGQTFGVGDYGYALWAPPMAPICFKTT